MNTPAQPSHAAGLRQVLECGSPLPLFSTRNGRKRQRTAALQNAGAALLAWALAFLLPLAPAHAAVPLTPNTQAPLIIPQPKSMRPGAGQFVAPATLQWSMRATDRDQRLWQAATAAFGASTGVFAQTTKSGVVLQCGTGSPGEFPTWKVLPKWASDPEGYRLLVETNGLAIFASTPQGAFYGLQTLAQLWREAGTERACPVIDVQDWPSMRFRGVHWFPSASGVPMHLKLTTNVFAAFKFNRSVIQCEAAQWASHPEITAPNAVSKEDLRRLVEAGRACWIEPIPLINVPGHAEWVFRNQSNLSLAEDPKTPYAYCVNNPKSYEFIQDILGECLPIFGSKVCHIGHDEVTMRGRFPNPDCPLCKNETVTALVIKHANRLSEWLREQDVETMIWGDMLLGPGEAKDATHAKTLADAQQRRSKISKKTIIVDWHYAASADARSIEILRKDGFRVVAASWFTPENIQHLAQAAQTAGAEGLLQTTWMGYFPDERAMKGELRQFTAFILAAEYAWSGRTNAPTALGYDPKEVFQKAYAQTR